MAIRVGVIGAGSWGTTVAALVAKNTPTILWAREPALALQINDEHRNGTYLEAYDLPENLEATSDLEEVASQADVVVMGVPSQHFREVLTAAAGFVRPWVPVVSLAKGLERDSLKRMSEVVLDVLPGHPVAVLTGPNLAKEILAGQPAASVVAVGDQVVAGELQRLFTTRRLRV
jgi:glycerol-3-phosphate dehydrogenase (NAD(P)+)